MSQSRRYEYGPEEQHHVRHPGVEQHLRQLRLILRVAVPEHIPSHVVVLLTQTFQHRHDEIETLLLADTTYCQNSLSGKMRVRESVSAESEIPYLFRIRYVLHHDAARRYVREVRLQRLVDRF
mgnify:CR=1 FL=1